MEPVILVVEDQKLLRNIMCDVLKENNFNTIEAADGMEGLDKLESYNPSLIVTDIIMPNYNGTDFIDMVKTLHPEMKILVASTLGTSDELYQKAKALVGVENMIKKPIKDEEFIAKVKKVLL